MKGNYYAPSSCLLEDVRKLTNPWSRILAVFEKQATSEEKEYGVKETMHWIPIGELDKYKAYPAFMKNYLQSEHRGIEHIITDERV